MYDHTFLNLQITRSDIYEATHKVGCQPGDCIYGHVNLPQGCVGMYGLTYSPPRVYCSTDASTDTSTDASTDRRQAFVM